MNRDQILELLSKMTDGDLQAFLREASKQRVLIPEWFLPGDLELDDADWGAFLNFTKGGDWDVAVFDQADLVLDRFCEARNHGKGK
jgi:hypothetical protein